MGGDTYYIYSPKDNWYRDMHRKVAKERGKAKEHKCVNCGKQAYDWARLKGNNGRSIYNFDPMCRSCHVKYDADERWLKKQA